MIEYLKLAPFASGIFFVTIIVSLYGLFVDRRVLEWFILRPYNFTRKKGIYTIITSGFIHADLMHLFFNMFTFYFFAFYFEMFIGHYQFVLIYFVSMIAADIPSIINNKDNYDYASLGASGAISAVLFGFILYEPLSKISIFPIPIGIPAIIYGVLYLIYCIWASKKQYNNINHSAHFWGAISGIVLTILLDPKAVLIFLDKLNINF
jgi:membrane associated rhomboid family serine protease